MICFICNKEIMANRIYYSVKRKNKKEKENKVINYCGHHSGVEFNVAIEKENINKE